jgi:hypothetical protein
MTVKKDYNIDFIPDSLVIDNKSQFNNIDLFLTCYLGDESECTTFPLFSITDSYQNISQIINNDGIDKNLIFMVISLYRKYP